MLLVGECLQGRFRLGLHVQDAFDRLKGEGSVTEGPFQSGQQVLPVVQGAEGKDLPSLSLALAVGCQ